MHDSALRLTAQLARQDTGPYRIVRLIQCRNCLKNIHSAFGHETKPEAIQILRTLVASAAALQHWYHPVEARWNQVQILSMSMVLRQAHFRQSRYPSRCTETVRLLTTMMQCVWMSEPWRAVASGSLTLARYCRVYDKLERGFQVWLIKPAVTS